MVVRIPGIGLDPALVVVRSAGTDLGTVPMVQRAPVTCLDPACMLVRIPGIGLDPAPMVVLSAAPVVGRIGETNLAPVVASITCIGSVVWIAGLDSHPKLGKAE